MAECPKTFFTGKFSQTNREKRDKEETEIEGKFQREEVENRRGKGYENL